MSCSMPLYGYFSKTVNEPKGPGLVGKRSVVFTLQDGYFDRPVALPCGTCLGCRMERARQWALRCMHEAKLYDVNSFVTLTYNEAPVLSDGAMTLRPRDFVLFMKRLRKSRGIGVRFFQCGEYGETTVRPHHHVLLFNCGFPDRVHHGASGKNGDKLYRSKELEKLWGHGMCWIGDVSFESAGYVARYALKKVVQQSAIADGRVQEYCTMSRRPGIGKAWADRFLNDFARSDSVVVNGVETKMPRYYEALLEKRNRGRYLYIKQMRRERAAASSFERAKKDGSTIYSSGVVLESKIRLLSRKAV